MLHGLSVEQLWLDPAADPFRPFDFAVSVDIQSTAYARGSKVNEHHLVAGDEEAVVSLTLEHPASNVA